MNAPLLTTHYRKISSCTRWVFVKRTPDAKASIFSCVHAVHVQSTMWGEEGERLNFITSSYIKPTTNSSTKNPSFGKNGNYPPPSRWLEQQTNAQISFKLSTTDPNWLDRRRGNKEISHLNSMADAMQASDNTLLTGERRSALVLLPLSSPYYGAEGREGERRDTGNYGVLVWSVTGVSKRSSRTRRGSTKSNE